MHTYIICIRKDLSQLLATKVRFHKSSKILQFCMLDKSIMHMSSILQYWRFVDLSFIVLLHLITCVIIHFCCGQSEVTRRMEEMTVSKREDHNAEGTGVLPRAEIVRDEHPLSLGKTSVWNQYFQVWKLIITCCWVLSNLYYMLRFVVWTLKYHHLYFSIAMAHGDQTIFVMCSYAHNFNVQSISYMVFCNVNQLHDYPNFLFICNAATSF